MHYIYSKVWLLAVDITIMSLNVLRFPVIFSRDLLQKKPKACSRGECTKCGPLIALFGHAVSVLCKNPIYYRNSANLIWCKHVYAHNLNVAIPQWRQPHTLLGQYSIASPLQYRYQNHGFKNKVALEYATTVDMCPSIMLWSII